MSSTNGTQSDTRGRKIGRIIMNTREHLDVDTQGHMLESDDEVVQLVQKARGLDLKIVLTSGTFDLVHIGHARYVSEAKKRGNLLIVGVEDDVKARGRKGPNRPVVPLAERREMLCHLRYVDAVVVKKHDDPKWHLIKLVQPDILIAVEGTYVPNEIDALKEFCTEVVVLPRQAETSTSAKVRTLVLDGAETLIRHLKEAIPGFVEDIYNRVKQEHGS